MSNYDDRLKDYVDVKERVRLFYEKYPDGRLTTAELWTSSEPDGVPRVAVHAKAYRTPDDPLPGDGWSWLVLPGSTPYTRGSEIENAETSAWGRAIGALGIGIDKSIASGDEVRNKQTEPEPRGGEQGRAIRQAAGVPEPKAQETEELVGIAKRAGMVRLGGGSSNQLEARQGPDGYVIGFRLDTGKDDGIPQVIVAGPAGDALMVACADDPKKMKDTRITVEGRVYQVKQPGRKGYFRLKVTAWEWGDYRFPFEEEALPEPPEDVPLAFEAPSEPLGLVPS